MATKRSVKILLALLPVAGVLAALLLLPRFVDPQALRHLALSEMERRTGVRLAFARAEVSFFPRPRVALREAVFDLPGCAAGKVASVEADPELLPLLLGRVRIAHVRLHGPSVRATLPPKTIPGKPFSAAELERDLAALLAVLGKDSPATVLTVRDGSLDVARGDGPVLSFRGIEGRAAFPPDRLSLSARCSSPWWESLSVEASLEPAGLRGKVRLEAKGLRLRELAGRLAPGALPWLGETVVSLRGTVRTEGARSVAGDFAGSVPVLTVRRGDRVRPFRGGSLEGSFDLRPERFRLALADVSLDDPRLRLSGELSLSPRSTPAAELRLEGRDVEVPQVRSVLLDLAGDVPAVRATLDVVRGGTLSRLSLGSSGASASALAELPSIRGKGTLGGGTIFVPGADLTLTEVGGEVSLAGGILSGEGVGARLGKARAREGTVRMGLRGDDAPFRAGFLAEADLAELQPLLRRLVGDRRVREEIDRLRDVRGTASGEVVLGERLSSVRATRIVAKVDGEGRHGRIPYPVSIRDGEVAWDGASLSVAGLAGAVGRSTFTGLTGRLDTRKAPTLSLRGAAGRLHLGELHRWLSALEGVGRVLEPVRSARGVAEVESFTCAGPLDDPRGWAFDAAGRVEELELSTPLLPGPVRIARGRFRADPEEVALTDAEGSLLDSTLQGGVRLRGYREGIRGGAASLRGGVGIATARWACGRFDVPAAVAPRPPFTVNGATLSWSGGRGRGRSAAAVADLSWPGGPDVYLSVRQGEGRVAVDSLAVRDAVSDAKASFRLDPARGRGTFSGTLSGTTVRKVFPALPVLAGWVRGEVEAVVDRASPGRSTARGTLEVREAALPWKGAAPLAIRSLSLAADGRRVRVAPSSVAWDDVPVTLSGTVEARGGACVVDLEAAAGAVDLGRLLRSAAPEGGEKGEAEKGTPYPLRGTVRLRAESVSWDRFTWRGVRGQADVDGGVRRLAISGAELCGISMRGSLVPGPGGPSLEVVAAADGRELDNTLRCLYGGKRYARGTYSFSARVAGKGKGDDLVRSLRGPVELRVRDGRIHRWTMLSRVLSFLDLLEMLQGKFPDLREEGLPFRTLTLRGELKDGKLLLGEGHLDSPAVGVAATGEVDLLARRENLEVLVAPFRTVDAVIRRIPLVGHILGGTLVTIPVAVRGEIGDENVMPLEPALVGGRVVGIFERALMTPVRVISPVLPGKGRGEKAREEPGGPPPP